MRDSSGQADNAEERPPAIDGDYRRIEGLLSSRIDRAAKRLAQGDADLRDEIDAAGRRAIFEALQKYDPNVGVPVIPYVLHYVRARQLDMFRAEKRWRDVFIPFTDIEPIVQASDEYNGLDTMMARLRTDGSVPWLDPTEGRLFRNHVDVFVRRLSPRLRPVARLLYQEGASQAEAARELSISRAAVSKAATRIREKAKHSKVLREYIAAA